MVVGAGSAGCITARRCAELKLSTLLLDRKPHRLVGAKVCGDEVSKSHFEATGIMFPSEEEVASPIRGADIYPPSLKNEMRVRNWAEFDGWTVNRLRFGQRLLQEAIDTGVKFLSDCHVTEPILHNDRVVGVRYTDLKTGEEVDVRCSLVVDASGFAGVIRNKLDNELIERRIDKEDIALCHREIVLLKMPLAEPEVARVFLGSRFAPGGYAWVFPKSPESVNMGIGICGGLGRASPKALVEKFKEEYPLFYGCKTIEAGGGAVPVRRPLKSLVADGVAFVGDAALQVNPIHGGGIGPGMRAAIVLGEVAKEAIIRKDTTAAGLWHYNVRYLSDFGRRLAALQVFRIFLQQVSDEDINFGFERLLLEPEDLIAANRGDGIKLSIADKIRRISRSWGRLSLVLKLHKAARLMKRVNKIYAEYPTSPRQLETWNEAVLDCFKQADFS